MLIFSNVKFGLNCLNRLIVLCLFDVVVVLCLAFCSRIFNSLVMFGLLLMISMCCFWLAFFVEVVDVCCWFDLFVLGRIILNLLFWCLLLLCVIIFLWCSLISLLISVNLMFSLFLVWVEWVFICVNIEKIFFSFFFGIFKLLFLIFMEIWCLFNCKEILIFLLWLVYLIVLFIIFEKICESWVLLLWI